MFRSTNLIMFEWFENVGFDVSQYRSSSANISDFVLYSLPDGLWLCSYIMIIMGIWKNNFSIISTVCVSFMPFVALLSEILEYFQLKRGYFDPLDIFSYILGIIFAFFIVKLIK